ncbi:MAG: hypothetical protein GY862_30810 [Gammaproteobacteria bacterium]|nr:hypothetical protein [Gammaproteobacteria bacterium]
MNFSKSNYSYTACFCEENSWLLGAALVAEGIPSSALSVLMLSNAARKIPLFCQNSGNNDTPVLWDYHVILCYEKKSSSLIFDFDTRLCFPADAVSYCRQTFPNPRNLLPEFRIFVRTIPLDSYLRHFHSDRSHMLAADGSELSAFPPYPPIVKKQAAERIELREYLQLSKALNDGSRVVSSEEFYTSCVKKL